MLTHTFPHERERGITLFNRIRHRDAAIHARDILSFSHNSVDSGAFGRVGLTVAYRTGGSPDSFPPTTYPNIPGRTREDRARRKDLAMLQMFSTRRRESCDGLNRRDFLQVGALGLGALALPELLQARAEAKNACHPAT